MRLRLKKVLLHLLGRHTDSPSQKRMNCSHNSVNRFRRVSLGQVSPHMAHLSFGQMSDGRLRIFSDWRHRNRIAIKNKACFLNIDDLCDSIRFCLQRTLEHHKGTYCTWFQEGLHHSRPQLPMPDNVVP